jgi:hypothetical protein
MASSRSVNSATYNPIDFLPVYHTTARPTHLTADELDAIGFRRRHKIEMRISSVNYQNCRAFHQVYLQKWWELLGQNFQNVENCSATHVFGTRGDLLLTYYLSDPIHLPSISETPTFKFIAQGARYCSVHNQVEGRLAIDPPDDNFSRPVIRPTYCCSRMETQEFNCVLLGRVTIR